MLLKNNAKNKANKQDEFVLLSFWSTSKVAALLSEVIHLISSHLQICSQSRSSTQRKRHTSYSSRTAGMLPIPAVKSGSVERATERENK